MRFQKCGREPQIVGRAIGGLLNPGADRLKVLGEAHNAGHTQRDTRLVGRCVGSPRSSECIIGRRDTELQPVTNPPSPPRAATSSIATSSATCGSGTRPDTTIAPCRNGRLGSSRTTDAMLSACTSLDDFTTGGRKNTIVIVASAGHIRKPRDRPGVFTGTEINRGIELLARTRNEPVQRAISTTRTRKRREHEPTADTGEHHQDDRTAPTAANLNRRTKPHRTQPRHLPSTTAAHTPHAPPSSPSTAPTMGPPRNQPAG